MSAPSALRNAKQATAAEPSSLSQPSQASPLPEETERARRKSDSETAAAGRLRTLFIAHDAGLFGAQRTLLTLLASIDRSRFDCVVVCLNEGPFTAAVRDLGHAVHVRHMVRWVPAGRDLERAGRMAYTASCLGGLRNRAWAIAALIERHGIEAVFTNTVTCVEGAVAARMASVPHLWYITEPVAGNPELRGILPGIVYQKSIAALSDQVIFCSRSLAAEFRWLLGRGMVVYPGLPLPAPRDRAAARAALLAHTGLPAETQLVGIVGALQPRKDHATFVAAAAQVAKASDRVSFIVVGSGPPDFKGRIEQQIASLGLAPRTRLLGWWPGEIHDVMAGLDVLAISSIQESFGLTAIEALAVGTPVVSTRCGGPEEVLRDGVDGILVPVGDAAALAAGMLALLDDPDRARACGRAGQQRIADEFSVARYVAGIQDAIESTVKTRA